MSLATTTNKTTFKLFISGMSVNSILAIENIKNIADQYFKNSYELEIIDLNKNTEKAVEYQIIAIPTLIKDFPKPVRTILGDLSDRKKILKILDIED